MTTSTSFVFPFTTCEIPTKSDIEQPVSALVNLFSTIVLLFLTFKAKSIPVRLTLFCYAMFEAFHTFSHVKHLNNMKLLQTNIVHILGYLIAFTSLWSINTLSKKRNSVIFYIILSVMVFIDLLIWFNLKGIYTIFSGLSIFAIIIFGSYSNLHPCFQKAIPYLLLGLLLIFLLFVNENYNCERMIEIYKFPYHAIIEVVGFVLFIVLGNLFLKWDLNFKA